MNATRILILELLVSVCAATGAGLFVGGLLGPVAGAGAGLIVVAAFGLVLLLAYERGVNAR